MQGITDRPDSRGTLSLKRTRIQAVPLRRSLSSTDRRIDCDSVFAISFHSAIVTLSVRFSSRLSGGRRPRPAAFPRRCTCPACLGRCSAGPCRSACTSSPRKRSSSASRIRTPRGTRIPGPRVRGRSGPLSGTCWSGAPQQSNRENCDAIGARILANSFK